VAGPVMTILSLLRFVILENASYVFFVCYEKDTLRKLLSQDESWNRQR